MRYELLAVFFLVYFRKYRTAVGVAILASCSLPLSAGYSEFDFIYSVSSVSAIVAGFFNEILHF